MRWRLPRREPNKSCPPVADSLLIPAEPRYNYMLSNGDARFELTTVHSIQGEQSSGAWTCVNLHGPKWCARNAQAKRPSITRRAVSGIDDDTDDDTDEILMMTYTMTEN